jgi:ADP-ribosylglycohydrolase
MYDALVMKDLVADELRQRTETGFDVADLAASVEQGAGPTDLSQMLDAMATAERTAPWPYVEPDTLDLIIAELEPSTSTAPPPAALLRERLNGAWLGRIAGCMLGKPIERGDHWTSQHIRSYLELAGAYPLNNYLPVLDPMPAGYEFNPSWRTTTLGHIDGATRDDDIDYTILNLTLLEQHGQDLNTEHIGDAWLRHLPILATYTAERAAYRNLINGLPPPETATARNPYREWIGAAIRADAFGYVQPGQPRAAATLAYRDARLSHTGNGIYAAMWAAAMVAEALTGAAPDHIVRESVRHVPRRSRLAEAVTSVIASREHGDTWAEVLRSTQTRYGQYPWVHAINNACVVAAALLWSDGHWTRAVSLAVQAGWDTDSNGATVGSIMGASLGRGAIPRRFSTPLRDSVQPGLFGVGPTRISQLAARTASLAAKFAGGKM